jgi:hypothetical protein
MCMPSSIRTSLYDSRSISMNILVRVHCREGSQVSYDEEHAVLLAIHTLQTGKQSIRAAMREEGEEGKITSVKAYAYALMVA